MCSVADCMRGIFNLSVVPKVSEYLHDQGFECPKASLLVAVCLLSAVIESHIQELKNPVS